MQTPRSAKRATLYSMAILSLIVMVAPAARAQDQGEALQRAVQLFDAGDYLSAQEVLVGIDRAKLTPTQQETRDDYLTRVQSALTQSEKAVRDLEDAETAMGENETDRAKQLLQSVVDNEYAPDAVRQAATAYQRQLTDARTVAQVEGETGSAVPSITPEDNERARTLTQEGKEMLEAGRSEEAERLFNQALDAVPGYPEAIEGLREIALHQEVTEGTRAQALIDRIRREDSIRWQRTVAEYRDTDRQIHEHVANAEFEEAQQALVRARQVVEAGRQFADPIDKYEALKAEVQALAEFVRDSERSYHQEQVETTMRQIEEQREARLRADREMRERQVEQLMAQARQHRKDGDLDAAISVLQQVSIIDPRYKPARWMLEDLEQIASWRRGREVRNDIYSQSAGALQEVEKAKIPWYQTLLYPDDWPEIVARRSPLGGRLSGSNRIFAALDKRIRVDFASEPFDEVLAQLATNHNLNIVPNWPDLKLAGVDRKAKIDLYLPTEISLKRALTEIVEQAGAGSDEVGYDVRDDIIKIASRKTLDKETYTVVYDINDLLMEIPHFADSPMRDLRESNDETIAHMNKSAPTSWGEAGDDEPDDDPRRTDRLQQIITLIQDTVSPESWRDRGGLVGTIAEINGQLVVTQNSASQREIGDLLGKLREQRAVQIAVEARFVTVSSNYLEELGIDIDVVLNSGNAGYDYVQGGSAGTVLTDPVLGQPVLLPRTFSQLGFTPNTPVTGTAIPAGGGITQPYNQTYLVPQHSGGRNNATPVPIRNNITAFTDPSSLGSDVPGSYAGNTLGPAFSLFGSFLDNIQVDFLIRATQADSRTTVVTAPQLVLFNGQRSWVAVTVQQNFVSTLQPVVAQGAVAQAPQTGTINSGAVLDVEATVTADRRYVTMTVRPAVTRLLDLQLIPFSGGAAGGGFGTGAAVPAFVQLPTLSTQTVRTTVSVPDGGTLLLGGQKLASEQEVEAGVPILSKIPILKRVYSSRTMVKDEQILLILIKPKILIQTEQEELAFPGFVGG